MTRQPQAGDGLAQYLTFQIASEEYGVPVLKVKEIIEYDVLTQIPSTPEYVRGVINLRGSVVPVMDLAVRFGMSERAITRRTCIVIVEASLEHEQVVLGVMADAVNQVVDLADGDIEPPPVFGTRLRPEFLLGMGKMGKQFALILDIDRVLSAAEMVAVGEVAQAGAA